MPVPAVFDRRALRQLVAAPAAAAPVLVVEHDAATRRVLAQVLRHEGFAVTTAADGSHALTTLARQRPAAVLLDLSLPDLPGVRVAADVRARYADAVPIIVVAGARPSAPVAATVYITKPVDLRDMVTTVARVLSPA
jgi:DNA-binding response OmpR family regulator